VGPRASDLLCLDGVVEPVNIGPPSGTIWWWGWLTGLLRF
jgi:hypothetical protein